MNEKEDVGENNLQAENPFVIKCPVCGLNSSIILDPKKVSDEKSLRLCLVCGLVFEYFNPSENKIMRKHS